jgi:hypothetical protein
MAIYDAGDYFEVDGVRVPKKLMSEEQRQLAQSKSIGRTPSLTDPNEINMPGMATNVNVPQNQGISDFGLGKLQRQVGQLPQPNLQQVPNMTDLTSPMLEKQAKEKYDIAQGLEPKATQKYFTEHPEGDIATMNMPKLGTPSFEQFIGADLITPRNNEWYFWPKVNIPQEDLTKMSAAYEKLTPEQITKINAMPEAEQNKMLSEAGNLSPEAKAGILGLKQYQNMTNINENDLTSGQKASRDYLKLQTKQSTGATLSNNEILKMTELAPAYQEEKEHYDVFVNGLETAKAEAAGKKQQMMNDLLSTYPGQEMEAGRLLG